MHIKQSIGTMRNLGIAMSIAILICGNASAQTCANPLPLQRNGTMTGDLCAASNDLPGYGNTASPQNEVIYSFVADDNNGTISVQQGNEPSWTGGQIAEFLMPSPCSSSTDPIAFGYVGTPMAITDNNAPEGSTLYVIFTSDPGGTASACGTFTAFTVWAPVELQTFVID